MNKQNNTFKLFLNDVGNAYVFCQDNLKTVDRVTYLPIHMLMFLHRTEVIDAEFKFNLEGLSGRI